MTLSEYEVKLKSCNPKLHIKRYGTSMAGIHLGSKYICRVPQGEILENNTYCVETGRSDDQKSDWNPQGFYKYKRMTHRGRAEAARILYTSGLVSYSDLPTLS